jgi:hypothetical protein
MKKITQQSRIWLTVVFIIFDLFNAMLFYQFKLIPNVYITGFFAVASLVTFVAEVILNKDLIRQKRIIWAILMLAVIYISSLIHLSDVGDTVRLYRFLVAHATCLLLLFAGTVITDENSKEKMNHIYRLISAVIVSVMFCASLISVVMYIMQKVFGFDWSQYTALEISSGNRLSALYQNSNLAGMNPYIAIFLSLLLMNKGKTRKWQKAFLVCSIAVQVITLLLSNCRATIIMLVIYLLYEFAQWYQKKKQKKIRYGLLVTVFLIFFVAMMMVTLEIRYKSFSVGFGTIEGGYLKSFDSIMDRLTSLRWSLDKEVIQLGLRSPIIGNGLQTLQTNAVKYLPLDSIAGQFGYETSHNIYIDAFYFAGVIGLALVIYFTVMLFKEVKYRKQYIGHHQFVLEAFLLAGIFEYSLLNPAILFTSSFPTTVFWLYFGFVCCQNQYHRRTVESQLCR